MLALGGCVATAFALLHWSSRYGVVFLVYHGCFWGIAQLLSQTSCMPLGVAVFALSLHGVAGFLNVLY